MTRPKLRTKKESLGTIEWPHRARADLRAIDNYIAADDPSAAERWVGLLVARAEAAARLPLAGRVVPEEAQADVREVVARTYQMICRVREERTVVLSLFERHRLFAPTGSGSTEK